MKKKFALALSTVVAVSCLTIGVTSIASAAEDVTLVVNGEVVECEQPPVIEEGRTLVPFRAVGEALGAEVDWDGATKTVSFENEMVAVEFAIGGDTLTATDKATGVSVDVDVDVPAKIINDRTMVPVRVVSENLGFDVAWDQDTKTVTVTGEAIEETTEESTETTTEEVSVEESTEVSTEEVSEESTEEVSEETTVEEVSEEATEEETEEVSEETTVEETTVEETTEA
ncbi:MAG: copper amine oxidase N-terminal domain-containing protein [Lachnospirales bacterium]